MDVVLLELVAKLGQMGEVVRSRTAMPATSCCPKARRCATESNLKRFETERAQLRRATTGG